VPDVEWALMLRKAVQSPNWAWVLAGPVRGMEVPLVLVPELVPDLPWGFAVEAVEKGLSEPEVLVVGVVEALLTVKFARCEDCPGRAPAAAAAPAVSIPAAIPAAAFAVSTFPSIDLLLFRLLATEAVASGLTDSAIAITSDRLQTVSSAVG